MLIHPAGKVHGTTPLENVTSLCGKVSIPKLIADRVDKIARERENENAVFVSQKSVSGSAFQFPPLAHLVQPHSERQLCKLHLTEANRGWVGKDLRSAHGSDVTARRSRSGASAVTNESEVTN